MHEKSSVLKKRQSLLSILFDSKWRAVSKAISCHRKYNVFLGNQYKQKSARRKVKHDRNERAEGFYCIYQFHKDVQLAFSCRKDEYYKISYATHECCFTYKELITIFLLESNLNLTGANPLLTTQLQSFKHESNV